MSSNSAGKSTVYSEALATWNALFESAPEQTRNAAAGLIQIAAYLRSLLWELEQAIDASGAIKIHPQHPEIQKQVPAVREYARLAESYANIVNKLNRLLAVGGDDDGDDELDEFQ